MKTIEETNEDLIGELSNALLATIPSHNNLDHAYIAVFSDIYQNETTNILVEENNELPKQN